jgi:hypothetical protein
MKQGLARHWLIGLTLCVVTVQVGAQEAEVSEPVEPGFSVVSAETHVVDDVVRLKALFNLRFSDKLIEALKNGVPLNLLIEIEVVKERDYLWSDTVATLEQRIRISYQPLTDNYLYTNLNSGEEFEFPTLESLVAVTSVLGDFPLIDATLLEADSHYRGEIRISIDRDSFPTPLRLMSYVSSDWHLSSDWYTWPLQIQ